MYRYEALNEWEVQASFLRQHKIAYKINTVILRYNYLGLFIFLFLAFPIPLLMPFPLSLVLFLALVTGLAMLFIADVVVDGGETSPFRPVSHDLIRGIFVML